MTDSIVQSQIVSRQEKLMALTQIDDLQTIEEMRAMLLLLQEEMTEAGKVKKSDKATEVGTDPSPHPVTGKQAKADSQLRAGY